MIVAVSGWRDWTDEAFVVAQLELIRNRHGGLVHIRVGNHNDGVDRIVRELCDGDPMWPSCTEYVADWDGEGKAAGPIRNRRMLRGLDSHDPHRHRLADMLLAFPQPGRSRPSRGSGTWDAVSQAHWSGIEVRIPGYAAAEATPADTQEAAQ